MNSSLNNQQYAQPLYTLAEQVLDLCAKGGADQAEVSLSQDTGFSVNVRLGEVETVERTNDQGVAVTVYVNKRSRRPVPSPVSPKPTKPRGWPTGNYWPLR